MTIVDLLSRHNHWATRTLIDACRQLTDEQLHQRFEIGPGTLHDTIRHIIGAMYRWADRMAEREVRPSIEADPAPRSLDELASLLDDAAADLLEVVSQVRAEKRIHEPLNITFAEDSETATFAQGTAIIHVFTHGVHHRAQALNMLRQLGAKDVPDLDAIDAELESSAITE